MVSFVAAASFFVASLAATASASSSTNNDFSKYIAPLRSSKAVTTPLADSPAVSDVNDIVYTPGAPVLYKPVNLYYIYYGNWTTSQKTIIEDFTKGLSTSQWYGITKQYYYQKDANATKIYVDGKIKLAKTAVDNYSLGKDLSGNALPNIIQRLVNKKKLPTDTNAIYVVFTSGDVKEKIRPDLGNAGFCTEYCGYHVSWKLKNKKRVYYAMVGNPTACLDGCAASENQQVSPNGDLGVDALLSVLAHEITEAVTDPWSDGTRAWQDGYGYEDGDKCAYNYGTTKKDSKGATYNVAWSGRKYLIQQNWSPVSQSCRLKP